MNTEQWLNQQGQSYKQWPYLRELSRQANRLRQEQGK